MHECWEAIDREILSCLADRGARTPGEIAAAVGTSEGEATALLAMLAREGKVRICLVQAVEGTPERVTDRQAGIAA